MALINCKECKAKVSDQAKACPKCGAPLKNFTINKPDISKIFLIFKSNFFNFGNNIKTFISEIKKKDFSFSSSKKFVGIYFSFFCLMFILTLNTIIKDSKEKVQMSYEVADLLITSFNENFWFRENSKRRNYNFIDKKNYNFCIKEGKIPQKFYYKHCTGLRDYIGNKNLKNFTFVKLDKNDDNKISRDELQKQLISHSSNFINNPKIKTDAKDLLKLKSNQYFLDYIEALDKFNKKNYGKYYNGNINFGSIDQKDLNRDFVVTKEEIKTYHFYQDIMPMAEFIKNNQLPRPTIDTLISYKKSWEKNAEGLNKRKSSSSGYRSNRSNSSQLNNNMFMSADQRLISEAEKMYRRASACYRSLPSDLKTSARDSYYDASKYLRDGKKYLTLNNQKYIGQSYLKNSISYSDIVLKTGRAFGSNSCK
jgi:hypothetical protein